MSVYVRSHPVEDASGARFQIHEYKRGSWPLWPPHARRHFKLDTGEAARVMDKNTFTLVSTGEALLRVVDE